MRTLRTHGKMMSPQIKYIAPGRPVLRFALVAVSEGTSTWHSCVAWGNTAEKMSTLEEGDMIEVDAKSVTRSFTSSIGARRTVTEYVVSTFKTLKEHGKERV
jgi:single-stranded DNA-binding protein